MFLDYGLNKHGEMIHISDVGRGRVPLDCPYCGMGLIARKGKKLAHHFAHDGETCREVATRDNVQLPAYDSFGLSLSSWMWQALQKFHQEKATSYREKKQLEAAELIRFNQFAGRTGDYELTYLGGVPFGDTTLSTFADIQRDLLTRQHDKLEGILDRATTAANKRIALADLQLYRAQLRRVLTCDLYFMEISHGRDKLYKIGVTGRTAEERAAEIERDLFAHVGKVKIKILRLLKNQGSIEHYFKHRYKDAATAVGNFTEYLMFDNRRNVLSDLTRLGDRALNEFEGAVIAEQLPATAAAIQNELFEAELSKRIKKGMQAAAAEGVHIGRPSEGTAETLAKYPAVVQAIEQGLSLRKAAASAGVSVNTVRKVKEAMGDDYKGTIS